MKNIIKTTILILTLVVVLAAFTSCDLDIEGMITEIQQAKCAQDGGHTMETYGEDLPTCTESGLSSGVVCSKCGYEERRRFEIPATGHDMADATCEDPSTCKNGCGLTEGEALGHDLKDVEATAPTCSAVGYTAHKACSRCKYTEGKEEVAINPDAHTLVDVEEQAPTCEKVGYVAHKACECGYTEGKDEIAATGHSFTIEVEALAPTTCVDGYTAHNKCEVCGKPDENYEEVYAPHNFSTDSYFYYPSAPTCTQGAYIAAVCSECEGAYIIDVAAALGHNDEDGDGVCDVCTSEMPHVNALVVGQDNKIVITDEIKNAYGYCITWVVFTADETATYAFAGEGLTIWVYDTVEITAETVPVCMYTGTANLEAGKTYYVCLAVTAQGESGEFVATVTKTVAAAE